ncbi:hypothetical protein [Ketobacter nezhaii]|uniref:hypothetical protein n=1 Tax=Ketobacter sp. MCCC 1A13808 TaxID=2602738 RepID=UPI0018DDBDCD|nr:hypothetical protein [Ketobacter sp. MCCC 1A13808]
MSAPITADVPTTEQLNSVVPNKLKWYRNKKLDQWICFWTVPFFYTLFGIIFVPLSWMMPPRSPNNELAQIVEFMQSQNLLIATTLLILSIGLAAVANACYAIQMRRMSVSPAFRIAFIMGSVAGCIVGCLFPMFCFGLGAFRPDYDPKILAMLYDFGYLSFIGSLGCFCIMWSMLGLAIILDKNRILPKWLGYYTVWQYMTELFAATVWIAKTGPFAWDGVMAFWFNMVLYVPWQIIIYYQIFLAIKNQPDSELGNADIASSGPATGATA